MKQTLLIPLVAASLVPSAFATVTVTSPKSGTTVTSPVKYVASATAPTCAKGVAAMGIFVNNSRVYTVKAATLNTTINLATGYQHTVVQEWDNCGKASYTSVNLTVSKSTTKTLTSVTVSPVSTQFAMEATQQFHAVGHYSDGSSADVTSTAAWKIANPAVASINSAGLATGLAAGTTSATATLNTVKGSAAVVVTVPPAAAVSVPLWHMDENRSGLNSGEASLTPANVKAGGFGKVFSYLVDGYSYAEPLVVSNLTVNGAQHNVLFVATEKDSVYAFDADSYGTGAPLWQVSLLKAGETASNVGTIKPYEGVTSTPAIDLASNTMYVVSKQLTNGVASFRLNALDLTTGAQKFGGPVAIQASVPGTNSTAVNGMVSLPSNCVQRAALLLAYGNVYVGFGSCKSGWLVGYDAQSLVQTGAFNVSPDNDGEGKYGGAGGVWMGSGGPVADGNGNVYITTGNGPWNGKTAFSDSIVKLSSTLQVEDYFTPSVFAFLNCNDSDLASGGLMLIPGTSELIAGGKQGKLFLVNSLNMGHELANDTGATQTLWFQSDLNAPYAATCTDASGTHKATANPYEIFGTSAYFNSGVYLGITPTSSGVHAGVRRFVYNGKLTPGSYSSPGIQQNTRGTTPFISADGNANGILWMIDTGMPLDSSAAPTAASLRAYDALDLTIKLYDSSVKTADKPGLGIKFTSPVVANGKVYISTGHDAMTVANPQGEIDVFGLK